LVQANVANVKPVTVLVQVEAVGLAVAPSFLQQVEQQPVDKRAAATMATARVSKFFIQLIILVSYGCPPKASDTAQHSTNGGGCN
jgi:hypothetical protein